MKATEMTEVKSSNIAKVGWAAEKLFVLFRGGNAIYEYDGVPEKVHQDLLSADSVGQFFSRNVRGKYRHVVRPQ